MCHFSLSVQLLTCRYQKAKKRKYKQNKERNKRGKKIKPSCFGSPFCPFVFYIVLLSKFEFINSQTSGATPACLRIALAIKKG